MYINNLYGNYEVAFSYDLDIRDIIRADIPFFKMYGDKVFGDILDLACGTGRVSIELVKALCKDIYAIDLSDAMLAQFHKKADRLDASAKKRLHIIKGDMSCFSLNKKFGMILIPFRSFQFLINDTVASNCLNCVYDHLDDSGIFIMSVFKVLRPYDQSWIGQISNIYDVIDPLTSKRVRRSSKNKSYDLENQVMEYLAQYKIGDDEVDEFIEGPITLKYYYYEQIKDLLEAHNFIINEEYGYYDKRTISEGDEMIFVCSKK